MGGHDCPFSTTLVSRLITITLPTGRVQSAQQVVLPDPYHVPCSCCLFLALLCDSAGAEQCSARFSPCEVSALHFGERNGSVLSLDFSSSRNPPSLTAHFHSLAHSALHWLLHWLLALRTHVCTHTKSFLNRKLAILRSLSRQAKLYNTWFLISGRFGIFHA